ncbi:hypothetical protein TNCV_3939121 [Trichonephila clavipes]|nr:hypothetical protein TNCV_3939121 [Trichonephila clavipes]
MSPLSPMRERSHLFVRYRKRRNFRIWFKCEFLTPERVITVSHEFSSELPIQDTASSYRWWITETLQTVKTKKGKRLRELRENPSRIKNGSLRAEGGERNNLKCLRHRGELDESSNVIEEVVDLVSQINIKGDSDDIHELAGFRESELTIDELVAV